VARAPASRGGDWVRARAARELKLVEKTIILSVRADPEPSDLVVLHKADGPISEWVTRAE